MHDSVEPQSERRRLGRFPDKSCMSGRRPRTVRMRRLRSPRRRAAAPSGGKSPRRSASRLPAFRSMSSIRTLSAVRSRRFEPGHRGDGRRPDRRGGLLTAVSFLALTGYDALALRQLRVRVPYQDDGPGFIHELRHFIRARVSSDHRRHGALLDLFSGRACREQGRQPDPHRRRDLLVRHDLHDRRRAAFRSEQISAINHLTPALNLLIGVGLLGAIFCYLVWVTLRRRIVRVQGFRLELPGLWLSLGQILLGVIDQCAAAGVLLCAVAAPDRSRFSDLRRGLCFACILGIASHAPGGIGVFEAAMLKAVPGVAAGASARFAASVSRHLLYCAISYWRWRCSAPMRRSGAGRACARRWTAAKRRSTISADAASRCAPDPAANWAKKFEVQARKTKLALSAVKKEF